MRRLIVRGAGLRGPQGEKGETGDGADITGDEIDAARDAAEASAAAALASQVAAQAVGTTNDAVVSNLIKGTAGAGPLTRAELAATFAPRWRATTAYTIGDKVLNPSGQVVSAKATFTSGASYLASDWDVVLDAVYAMRTKRAQFALGGDSLAARHLSETGSSGITGHQIVWNLGDGFLFVAQAMLGQRFGFTANYGVSGTRTDQWISGGQVTSLLADSCSWVVLTGPTNDREQAVAYATAKANYLTVVNALIAAGKKVVAIGLFPETSGSLGTTMNAAAKQFTVRWALDMKALSDTTPGFYFVDPFEVCADPASTDGNFLALTTEWTADGLHPTNRSVWRTARLLADLLDPLIPYISTRPMSRIDDRNQAAIANRNLLNNASVSGTGGTPGAGVGGTGSVASSFATTSSNGGAFSGTVVSSKVAATDQTNTGWQQITATGSASQVRCQQLSVTSGYTAGTSYIRAEVELDSDVDLASVTRLRLAALIILPSSGTEESMVTFQPTAGSLNIENRPKADVRGRYWVLHTPKILVPAAATSVGWYIDFTGLGTIRFRNAALRVDPLF